MVDIDPSLTDAEIWTYAIQHNKVILTKDSDFFYRCLASEQKARVVHFEIGNMTLKELHAYFEKNWKTIHAMLKEYYLIEADKELIRGVL